MISKKDLKVVIPSRKRVESCAKTVQLFHNPIVCVAEEEEDEYLSALDCLVVTHPNEITGIGRLRQWILDRFDDRCLVQCNDDVRGLVCMAGQKSRRIRDRDAILAIMLNAANIAEGMGACVWSFAPSPQPRMFSPIKPFYFTRIEGSLAGMIGREVRYDPKVAQFDDVDLALECLRTKRYVWQDVRFAPIHNFQTMAGGNSISRGKEKTAAELAHMKRKWGRYLRVHLTQSTVSLIIKVSRQQKINL